MAYSPQTWADGPAGGTAIDAARLRHIEAGVAAAAAAADQANADVAAGVRFVHVATGAEDRPAGAGLVLWINPLGVEVIAAALDTDVIFSGDGGTGVPAPSTPAGLASSAISAAGFTFSWSGSTSSGSVVVGYEYRVDAGAAVGPAAGLSRTLTGLTPGTTYTVQVRAVDALGQRSAWSAALSVTTDTVSAPTARHSIWGAAVPAGTHALNSDGSPNIEAGNCFYRFGSALPGMRVVGGKVLRPAGVTLPAGTVTVRAYTNSGGVPNSGGPTGFGTLAAAVTVNVAGLVEGWNEVEFPAPFEMPPNFGVVVITAVWNGNDDTYLRGTGTNPDWGQRFDAVDGAPVAWCEAIGGGYYPGVARIGASTFVGSGNASYGTDIVVDEGA